LLLRGMKRRMTLTSMYALRQMLTYYELDLGLNHVVRKWSEATDPRANLLVQGSFSLSTLSSFAALTSLYSVESTRRSIRHVGEV